MASNNKVTKEDLITCFICREISNDPRLMPCSHTYCYKCIKQRATNSEDEFECPLCNKCKILKKDIDSLPLNQSIQDLVELYGK
jgi:tripartite motif-containing protein 13